MPSLYNPHVYLWQATSDVDRPETPDGEMVDTVLEVVLPFGATFDEL